MDGIITKSLAGFYNVFTFNDQHDYLCKTRGKLKNKKIRPLVGDKVIINVLNDKEGIIEEIKPRTNELIRPPISNLQKVVLLFSVKSPELDRKLLDRLLVLANYNRIEAIICINKMDKAISAEELEIKEVVDIYTAIGYPVVLSSALKGEGVAMVKEEIKDVISALAGPSGTGKSTLINQLAPGTNFKTGDISAKLKRGKHTTRHVELVTLPEGGMIADTPGFTQLDVKDISPEQVRYCFPEFADLEDQCRFQGCYHHLEPNCAVKQSVDEKQINQERYNNYISFLEECRENERGY